MKIKMVFEVDDSYIKEYMAKNPNKNVLDVRNELSNWGYLSMDCMNAMVMRSMEVGVCDYWVEKTNDKAWGETWGDNFPTEDQFTVELAGQQPCTSVRVDSTLVIIPDSYH